MSDELKQEIEALRVNQDRIASGLVLLAKHSGRFVETAKDIDAAVGELASAFGESRSRVDSLIEILAGMAERNAQNEKWRKATDRRLAAIEAKLEPPPHEEAS